MDFKKQLPHLIAVLSLMAVSALFFAPNAFQGKVLPQADNDKARAMQTEIQDYLKKDGKAPLWTNSAFSGMPAYQIYSPIHGNLTTPLYRALLLESDISTSVWTQVFLAMLTMYLLLFVLNTDWRVATFGALAYGITTYNIDIIEAGHTTKMLALSLTPGILAGMVLTFNKRLLLGGSLMALFVAMQVYANHVQITYYTFLLCGIYFLAEFAEGIRSRRKDFAPWGKAVLVSGLAITMGLASNLSRLWPTYEYTQETIRGKSSLESKADQGSGLDSKYAFQWSYGVGESLTLLVPHYAGGGAAESFKDTKLYSAVSPQVRGQIRGLFYTGDQPFVGTAIYFGAIVCFLFLLGAWLVPGSVKYWLLGGGLFFISLAWGKNFFLNYFWFDNLPMFNKFRAVSMALGIAQLCFAMLGAIGLQKLTDPELSPESKKKALYFAAGTSIGLCLLAMMFGSTSGQNDNVLEQQPELLSMLKDDRAAMLQSDAFRSIGFILFAAAMVWFFLKGRIKSALFVIAVAAGALADNWLICSRTISPDKYETKRAVLSPPQEESFDKQIKQDPDPYYRVLDLARGNVTTNWTTSYFHKSMSGYHAAKMRRYQEVIDSFIGVNPFKYLNIVGMFNGKYVISPKGEVLRNPEACGNAWFVKAFEVAPTADAELKALGSLNTRDTAVVQQVFAETLKGLQLIPDSSAKIELTHYHPDKMEYEYSSQTEQLAVFSEIYYPPAKGWSCYLNGQPASDFIKVDYLLRAMRLPAGQHMKLEMRFEPKSFYLGEKIAMGASGLVILLFLLGLFWFYRANEFGDPSRLTDMPEPVSGTRAKTPPVSGKTEKKRK